MQLWTFLDNLGENGMVDIVKALLAKNAIVDLNNKDGKLRRPVRRFWTYSVTSSTVMNTFKSNSNLTRDQLEHYLAYACIY